MANRDINRFPVFKVKDKEALFRQRFAVPLINKNSGAYNPFRPAPTLGMRTGAVFIAKPLHDPSGEFAIVLYDPTVDDKPITIEEGEKKDGEEEKPKLDVPIMHKSLADILGLKKKVDDNPKIPVVIDPRLAKILRPHQVEGVKVSIERCGELKTVLNYGEQSFYIDARQASLIKRRTDASWQMRWGWAKL